jgi:aminomethyltransferase
MLKTPLDSLHRELGARMVPFAGYDMPVQYPTGILKEHLQTRSGAGLFDVSHMGQVRIRGAGASQALEALVPVDVLGLAQDAQTYALFTNDSGGVLDDLIVTRWGEEDLFLVVNAACKEQDIAHLRANLKGLDIEVMEDRALLALQGPAARGIMAQLVPAAAELTFMKGLAASLEGADVYITCSGYTGEDGFEISMPATVAEQVARKLLAADAVQAIGLGARDSLRLEAGLCLYGHELNTETTPVAAGLMWSIGKARRADGVRAGGFPGAEEIFRQQISGVARRRVGLRVEGKRPVRDGQRVVDAEGVEVGVVTSACFGASLGAPLAMAYVDSDRRELDTKLNVDVRGKLVPVTVVRMPFVPQSYYRG